MPVDKFGRHFLQTASHNLSVKSDTVSLPKSTPFYIWQPTNQHSKCVIKISNGVSNSKSYVDSEFIYFLENQETYYQFPIGGTIESLKIYPIQTKIKLNDTNNLSNSGRLIGQQVNKGDKLSFVSSNPENRDKPLYVEIVLQCPVTNE